MEALHAELARRDPVSAERLKPRDRTRIARALEVIEATGRTLPDWHREGLPPLLPPGAVLALFLAPERDAALRDGSMRGSTRCWTPARWRRSRRWPRESSIPCCRR